MMAVDTSALMAKEGMARKGALNFGDCFVGDDFLRTDIESAL
jgi:hypothetical protein